MGVPDGGLNHPETALRRLHAPSYVPFGPFMSEMASGFRDYPQASETSQTRFLPEFILCSVQGT